MPQNKVFVMDSLDSLVLNAATIPVSIVSWQRAVTLIFAEKAVAVANYDDQLRSSSGFTMPKPSVIQCTGSDFMPKRFTRELPFSRRNVYIRDKGCCMYCGKKVSLANFTFDHIHPRCLGGLSSWLNVVVSCLKCNTKKGGKALKKSGMSLIHQPYVPKLDKAAPAHLVSKIAAEIPHETWMDFIYWSVILDA